ncbi:hypothetical protein ACTXL6_16575 [Brachybacterium tyrofermentans]|uniref:hypothetical protein n=1 Tax=Brachybacterium tyrofermentans TaxID=47848 RepID=UPI003FD135A2
MTNPRISLPELLGREKLRTPPFVHRPSPARTAYYLVRADEMKSSRTPVSRREAARNALSDYADETETWNTPLQRQEARRVRHYCDTNFPEETTR